MAKNYALFNPLCGGGLGEDRAKVLSTFKFDKELEYVDITTVSDYSDFFNKIDKDDSIIICGGDGTLNRFVNDTALVSYKNRVFYYPCGNGNDFYRDIGGEPAGRPVSIDNYIKNLPVATVKGKKYRFLNNVGFGIDGYCSMVGDRMIAEKKENINFTAITIRGILGGFRPVNAAVTVDGKTEVFKRAWLASTMKGRYYGGGMMPTPLQNRNDENETLSVMVFYGKGKLPTMMAFQSIFQGEHVKQSELVKIITGKEITVKFERPCPLQIDGETILDVSEYDVKANCIDKKF